MTVVGIVPAAGHATRLQPLGCSKEVLPIGGRPVMDYVLDRMRAAPCQELRVVTRPDKEDVISHARAEGASVIEARPAALGGSLLCGLEGLHDGDVALIGFPDSIWEPLDGYASVVALLGEGCDVALGLFRAGGDMRRFEPVVLGEDGRVERIDFKPEHASSDWMWGCAALTVAVLRDLPRDTEPGVYFDSLARRGRVAGVRLSDSYTDVGTRQSLAGAQERDTQGPLRALLLGSGGWIPTAARATGCALLRQGDHAVAIDAGTGIARLVERPSLLEGVARLDVVLTHFHLDHVVGLAYLPAALPRERVRIVGPGQWLYGVPTRELLDRLISPPLFALGVDDVAGAVEDLPPSADLTLGSLRVRARAQERHDAPTLALRFDDLLTYCTDTAADEGNAGFAKGSRVLVHEAWCTEDARTARETHSSAGEAARLAEAAGVERLVLIHVHPRADEQALLAEARTHFPRTTVGSDWLPLL